MLNELAFNLESFNPAFAATVLKVPALAACGGRAGAQWNEFEELPRKLYSKLLGCSCPQAPVILVRQLQAA